MQGTTLSHRSIDHGSCALSLFHKRLGDILKYFASEYVGNIHVHSLFSDGASDVFEITRSAEKAGLDFIIFNEHDYMTDDLHLESEGFHRGVLVLMGLEIGGRHHHYLAFDLKEMIRGNSLTPQEVIDQVNAQGGFGCLAHPFEKGMLFHEGGVAYTWEDLSVKGYTGICIWNFTSRWKERIKTPMHGLFFLLFKTRALKGPSTDTLSFWDRKCQQQKMAAIGGSDAHGGPFTWGGLKFTPLSYDYLVNSINVHVLLSETLPGEFKDAKKSILSALKEGRVFVAHDNLASAKGFRFYFESETGSSVLEMGQEDRFQPGTLFVESPGYGEIRLFKDGTIKKKWRARKGAFRVTGKGVYRVEVYRKLFPFGWRPWIYSNPVYLR